MLYYIQTTGFHGNSCIWWGKNSRGYTSNIKEAGMYTEKEAKDICATSPSQRAWPVEYIDSCKARITVIDSQYLDYNQIAKL